MHLYKVFAASMAAVAIGSAAAAQAPAAAQASADKVRAHMAFLASDLLEGREAGTRGYDIAAEYSAAQFAQLGLRPAGDNGTFFQRVPLTAYRPLDRGSVTMRASGQAEPLVAGVDFLPGRDPLVAETKVSAPVVFVGYGVVAPERGRDDFADLDVRGRIVVALEGAPRDLQTEERAYYRSSRTKRLEAEKRGAIGFISIETPTSDRLRPFANSAKRWQETSMTWRGPDGRPYVVAPTTPMLGSLSLQGAAKLFAGAPVALEQIYAASETDTGATPRFALPVTLDVSFRTEIRDSESRNVAALIPGSDPRLAAETVVLSAHLDHEGIDPEASGDKIYNGALDNAGGVATTFEVARAFVESGRRPKRSMLFLLVTAEEKGLIGAEYFARNPTVLGEGLVANVNLDMPILTYNFTDVVAFGADRSGIGPLVRRAAGRLGVALSPDPMPEEGLFTRSDHYRFVEAGVPSVFLMTGFANGGEARFREFLKTHYHKPSDQLDLPIDYLAAAKFATINYEIARELADAPARPKWNVGDFFGSKFGPRRALAD